MLQKIKRINDKIKQEIRKYLKTNTIGNKIFQNLWDVAKAVTGGKFIVITGLPQETRKISNKLTYHLKELEKEQTNPKVSRGRKK